MSVVPIAGSTFTFEIPGLYDMADTTVFVEPPAIAAGDFQISVNGAAFENLDNLPTVAPAGSTQVQVVVSAAETTAAGSGGRINVRWVDAADDEWCSGGMMLRVSATELDSLSTAASIAALNDLSADEVWDEAVEGAYTARQFLRLFASALFGEVSGGGTATVTFRDTADTTDRIVATVTANGNRTTVTLDAT